MYTLFKRVFANCAGFLFKSVRRPYSCNHSCGRIVRRPNLLGLTIPCLALILHGCASLPEEAAPLSTNQQLVQSFSEAGLEARETRRGVAVYSPKSFFGFDQAEISQEAGSVLRFISDVVNSDLTSHRLVSVEGHADSWGSQNYNLKLSKQRALVVKQFLIDSGVQTSRVSAEWFGESRPLLPETMVDGTDNPKARASNRRVEIILLNSEQG